MKSKSIDFLFLAAFLFIGITLFTTYSSFRKLDTFNQLVDHSYLVKNKITDLESQFRSMVSNQRTYLLSEDPEHLVTYRQRKEQVDILFKDLESLILDNPEQLQNLKALKENYVSYTSGLQNELNLFSEGGFLMNSKIKKSISTTTQYSEDFITAIEAMDDVESNLLRQRLDNQWQGERMTPIAFSVLGLLSFAVIAFAFFRQKVDLSEKEKLLTNKRQLLKRLLNSNADLEEYAYLASHDLQEPLRKIQMFTDTAQMAMEREKPEDAKRFLQKIDNSSREAQKMVKGLLEHAQMDRNKEELSLARISDIFKEVAAEFREANQPDLSFDIQVEETPMVMVYEGQIMELLGNLFSNAVKFRKENSRIVHVSLSYSIMESEEEYHHISIADKGVGFEPSNSKLIFEMFGKLSLHKNSKKNNLGLSLCKKIMENHRGRIYAESDPGKGSTFHLLFPKNI